MFWKTKHNHQNHDKQSRKTVIEIGSTDRNCWVWSYLLTTAAHIHKYQHEYVQRRRWTWHFGLGVLDRGRSLLFWWNLLKKAISLSFMSSCRWKRGLAICNSLSPYRFQASQTNFHFSLDHKHWLYHFFSHLLMHNIKAQWVYYFLCHENLWMWLGYASKPLQSILKSYTFNMMGRSSDDCHKSSLGPGPDN